MKKLRELLKEQIAKSVKFEKSNKDAHIAQDFDATIKDILHSDTICSMLMSQQKAMALATPGIIAAVNKYTGEPATAQNIILANMSAWIAPLALFYWGMQIGKELSISEALDTTVKATKEQPVDTKALKSELEQAFEQFSKKNKKNIQKGEDEIFGIEGSQI